MNKLEDLTDDLIKFDYSYIMSEDHRTWQYGRKEEERIKQKIMDTYKHYDYNTLYTVIKKYEPNYGVQFLGCLE